jgi:hypothetical protein
VLRQLKDPNHFVRRQLPQSAPPARAELAAAHAV